MVVCQMAKLCIILGVFVSELWGGIFFFFLLYFFFFFPFFAFQHLFV